ATLDWSHDLLSEQERLLLRRLFVFAGTWTLEAVEEVCAGPSAGSGQALTAGEIVPLLVHLVEKSLVLTEQQDGATVYRLLETVRQYGAQRVREAGEEATLRDRHLAWFAAIAEQAEDPLWSPDQVAWFTRLTAAEDNLRAALEWSTQASARAEQGIAAIDAGLRLGGALWHYWNLCGHLNEGRARLLDLLATGLGEPAPRAKA